MLRASLANSLELAKAIYTLGGNSEVELCAEQMGKRNSGAFHALYSAAMKFGIVRHSKGKLFTTEKYKKYKHAYSEQEGQRVLLECFLSVPLFAKIAEKFDGQKLPQKIFPSLLIREYGVDEKSASRVAKYFIQGAITVGLLNEDGLVNIDKKSIQDKSDNLGSVSV